MKQVHDRGAGGTGKKPGWEKWGGMKKGSFWIVMVFLMIAPAVMSDEEAFRKRDWERLMNTGCCQNCRLLRAPLSRIDLTEADMRGSDLRGADFRQATLYKALLPSPEMYHGADFSGAMWVDGRICKKGSIGYCRVD